MFDFVVTNKHPMLLKYIDYLQHKNAEALSFYPLQVFEREMEKGRLLLGLLNNEPCGYIYMGASSLDMKIHQVCIQYDLRRRLYGASLVSEVENVAIKNTCRTITLRCGFDLEANDFWNSLGYRCVRIVDGGVRRMRKINVWRKYLQTPLLEPELFIPAEGKTNANLWRANKEVGTVSRFNRGKVLGEYRKQLITKGEH